MEVHRSALKHGVSREDAIHAATTFHWAQQLDDDEPGRELRLGFSRDGVALEIVVLTFDDGRTMVIHAMKMRAMYARLLASGGNS